MRHGNKSNSQNSNNQQPSREFPGGPVQQKSPAERSAARFDRPGHLADEHAQRLLKMSKRRPRDDVAFIIANRGTPDDDLAEELAEQAVSTMTTGGDTWMDFMDRTVDEEEGGPFVETRGSREFARGSAEVDGFLREALPTTRSGVKGRGRKN
jgi:hypothetical protein